MIRTMDAILPQLEALVATGNDVYNAVGRIPGVAAMGRFVPGVRAAGQKVLRWPGHAQQVMIATF